MPTTETNTNAAIRERLTGDDGKCRKRCEMCGGDGICPFDENNIRCSDCTNGYIENRERIAAATYQWTLTFEHNVPHGWPLIYKRDLWVNRHDQPWCTDLEEFIDEYVEPAPDYDSPEGMVELKKALHDSSWGVIIGLGDMVTVKLRHNSWSIFQDDILARSMTEHTALYTAVRKAVGV